jgi:hypothetical protein
LAALKTAGLLQQRRDGKWVHYRLAERALNAYAPAFLALLGASLADDPTVGLDLRTLALVNAVPIQTLCDQGRATLGPNAPAADAAGCCGVAR